MRRVALALASGLVVLAATLGVTLSRSPPLVARSVNTEEDSLGYNEQGLVACQAGELLPAGTTAIRLSLGAYTGPSVKLEALAGSQVVASGQRAAGWTGRSVTVALERAPTRSSTVKLCFGWKLEGAESVSVYGDRTRPARAARLDNGSPALGRVGVEYLRPGSASWSSLLGTVARHMGLGRAGSGGGIAVLAVLLMVGVLALSSGLILRELR
jgi:hypothetical protein